MSNKNIKNTEFEKIINEIKEMRKRYMIALSSHEIYKEFKRLVAINIAGKKRATKNAKLLGSYTYFYQTTKEATKCYFLIELAKFFDNPDKRNNTRTVHWILDYAKNNIHRLGKKNFLKYHGIDSEIFYKPLKMEGIKKLQNRIKKNNIKIKKLKDYRDQYLVHDDMKKRKIILTIREAEVLLRIVKDTINLFYAKLKSTSNSYTNFKQEPIIEINRLIKAIE